MTKCNCVLLLALCAVCSTSLAAEHDYYRDMPYRPMLVPGVGLDRVEQAGGPDTTNYERRTVKWWPRKGQDIVDIPEGAPLRVWTRNKGQQDKEALAGICRTWTTSDPDTFKAHLVGFRGFAVPTPNPMFSDDVLIPAAILRMENGEQRVVVHHTPFSLMLSPEDHDFILAKWREEWPKLTARLSEEERIVNPIDLKEFPPNHPGYLVLESKRWRFQAGSKTWVDDYYLLCPEQPRKQANYRKGTLEYAEHMWEYWEAAGAVMPFWREFGPKYKFAPTTGPSIKDGWEHIDPGNGGGYGRCTLYWCGGGPRNIKLSHEFGHSGFHGENGCNAMIHTLLQGEVEMFSHNFCYPWRTVMYIDYQAGLWMIALGDNPNWGSGVVPALGSLRSKAEPTLYHVVARLGQKKGLWKNGIKGFGDFFGEYAARMVTCDFTGQYVIRAKYGMPEISCVYPVSGRKNTYRIPNSEAPRTFGFNIVRLDPDDSAKELVVDFHGFHNPERHSDWRACIVAVDGNGRARYSPLWNKGKMTFARRPSDKHLWLTVAATPSAMPVREGAGWYHSMDYYFVGNRAPRFPWQVTLTGCQPGSPHRWQGDVVNLDELYTFNNGNGVHDLAAKHEVPLPTWDPDAELAPAKLAAMLPRIKGAAEAVNKRLAAGEGHHEYWIKNWCEHRKLERLADLEQRVKFLQRNAAGHRHPNGGGFVADNAKVARTAYVGPNAMVLDGARVSGNACIKEHAVVIGPKAVVSGNAKIGGKAWVVGDLKIDGNARILESALITTDYRFRQIYGAHSRRYAKGKARITGNAVIKGEHIMRLCFVPNQTLTGGFVVDYTPRIGNFKEGVFDSGRLCSGTGHDVGVNLRNGLDTGQLYAKWEFDYPKGYLLEDSYVNNNGILHNGPQFASEGDHKCVVFNGIDQYAEAPPSVADFGELTIDMLIKREGGGTVFDFGTGEDDCFHLTIAKRSGKPVLVARHGGKTHKLTVPEAVPEGKWTRVRVEMDGAKAGIYINGKRVARERFEFRPRTVFIGDRPDGNFIACSRDRKDFFKGRIDHFRIYRTTHEDFDSVGEPNPNADKIAAEWVARERKLAADAAFSDQERKRRILERRKTELLNPTSDKLSELKRKQLAARMRKDEIARVYYDKFRKLADTIQAHKRIHEINERIQRINRELAESEEYITTEEAIKELDEKIRDYNEEIRERAELKGLAQHSQAEEEKMRKIEESIKQRPDMKKAMELLQGEKDRRRRDQLHREYNGLLKKQRSEDAEYVKAQSLRNALRRRHQQATGKLHEQHPVLRNTTERRNYLRRAQNNLRRKRRAAHPELAKLEADRKQAEADLNGAKEALLAREVMAGEFKDEYEKLPAELETIDQAISEEKEHLKNVNREELALVDRSLKDIPRWNMHWGEDYKTPGLREDTIKAMLTDNPLMYLEAPAILSICEPVDFRTTADWEYRTPQEVKGEVPPAMRRWLDKVRDY